MLEYSFKKNMIIIFHTILHHPGHRVVNLSSYALTNAENYTSICRKTVSPLGFKNHENRPKKMFIGGFSKISLGNVVRKLPAKFHWASLIRKCYFKIGGTKSLSKQQKILILETFWHISKSRKTTSFSKRSFEQDIRITQENL